MIQDDCFKNTFLVAMPGMDDKRFERTVVYICEHGDHGALGLVINVPMKATHADLLIHLGYLNNQTEPSALAQSILWGGPCVEQRGFVLHRTAPEWRTQFRITDELMLTTSLDILESISLGDGPREALIAFGCARWTAGQLEKELADNSWLLVPASEQVLFECPVEERWSAAAHLMGVDLKLMTYDFGHA